MLPEWFAEKETAVLAPPIPGRYRTGFVDRTILGMSELIQNTIFSEEYASREGVMQGLAPRVKVIFLLAFALTASLARTAEVLCILYAVLLALSLFSRIPLSFFLVRVWLFIPLFSALVIAPAMLNVFTPGESIVAISDDLSITKEGVATVIFFVLRVAVSVSAVVLVQLTTKWHDILSSLSSFSVPPLFILTLEMCYRYIILLSMMVADLHLAKKSRTIASASATGERRWVAGSMAFLFKKSIALSEGVYNAMVSRGFLGQVKSRAPTRFEAADFSFLAVALLLCAALLLLERVMA